MYICGSSVIPAARYRDGSQSTGPCGQPAREIRLLGTYIFCFPVIPAARYRDGSQSTGPCGQPAREIRLLGTWNVHLLFLSFSHLTIEREPVGTAQVHSDLNKLSAEAAAEQSCSFSEDCEVSDIVCAYCLKKRRQTELCRCTGCKSFSYCNKVCQISDWPSHKQLSKSIQSLNPQN